MQEAKGHLSPEQAHHLTQHGVNQNEDGTYSWKFDNYVRADSPYGMTQIEIEQLWERISCPTLLVYGKGSWAANPETDGRLTHFRNARAAAVAGAAHRGQHDRVPAFHELPRCLL